MEQSEFSHRPYANLTEGEITPHPTIAMHRASYAVSAMVGPNRASSERRGEEESMSHKSRCVQRGSTARAFVITAVL